MAKNIKTLVLLIVFLLLILLIFYNSFFFDFDKIDHYRVTEMLPLDKENNSIEVENKEILSEIVYKKTPKKLNGVSFINNLNKITTKKQEIPASDFNDIKEIFKEQSCSNTIAMSCISVYRDILVFYKRNKIIGIAKICFNCKDHHIIGTTSNTSNFGQCGDYEKLNKILY